MVEPLPRLIELADMLCVTVTTSPADEGMVTLSPIVGTWPQLHCAAVFQSALPPFQIQVPIMPVPVKDTVSAGLIESFEATVSVPAFGPVEVGSNETETVQLPPAAIVGVVLPHGLTPPLTLRVYSEPDMDIFVTERSAVPVLAMVTGREAEPPTGTVPKS